MRIILLLSATMLTGCAATNSWLGIDSGATPGTSVNGSNWNYRTTQVITPQGGYLVNRAGNTITVIQTSKSR
jgi:hypothetical protein